MNNLCTNGNYEEKESMDESHESESFCSGSFKSISSDVLRHQNWVFSESIKYIYHYPINQYIKEVM